MRGVLAYLVSGLMLSTVISNSILAEQPKTAGLSPNLMRVQRKTRRDSSCVLLHSSGQFHMESGRGDRIIIIEGLLSASELGKVQEMIDSDGLQQLTPEKVASFASTSPSEILQVSIFRTDHWQNLVFMTDQTGAGIPPGLLNPLLRWMKSLRSHSHTRLGAERSNNCQSPKSIELETRR